MFEGDGLIGVAIGIVFPLLLIRLLRGRAFLTAFVLLLQSRSKAIKQVDAAYASKRDEKETETRG